jgi:hypothetical protein
MRATSWLSRQRKHEKPQQKPSGSDCTAITRAHPETPSSNVPTRLKVNYIDHQIGKPGAPSQAPPARRPRSIPSECRTTGSTNFTAFAKRKREEPLPATIAAVIAKQSREPPHGFRASENMRSPTRNKSGSDYTVITRANSWLSRQRKHEKPYQKQKRQ